jgi:hypothetical protein
MRINIVTAELLTEFLPGVRDRWNADLAGDTGLAQVALG